MPPAILISPQKATFHSPEAQRRSARAGIPTPKLVGEDAWQVLLFFILINALNTHSFVGFF